MFVKRNHRAIAGKQYQSALLVRGKRVPGTRRPGRPKAQEPPPKAVVVHETPANLSQLPGELIGLIEADRKGKATRLAHGLLGQYRLSAWVSVRLEGRRAVWAEDAVARQQAEQLDGCYVVESDLPPRVASTQQVHDRYLDLTKSRAGFSHAQDRLAGTAADFGAQAGAHPRPRRGGVAGLEIGPGN
jgi:hypothetical protein